MQKPTSRIVEVVVFAGGLIAIVTLWASAYHVVFGHVRFLN